LRKKRRGKEMDPNEEKIRQFLKKSIKVDINKQPTLEEK